MAEGQKGRKLSLKMTDEGRENGVLPPVAERECHTNFIR